MTPDISERAFEAAIECALLRDGPDACPGDVAAVRESPPTFGDEPAPGGYHRRRPEDYGRALCLLPADVVDFPSGHPAQGVGEARAAPRCRREAALPRPPLARDPRGPRPPRAALRLRALPRPLRGRPRAGVRDHLPRGAEDPIPALQPGPLRRRGQSLDVRVHRDPEAARPSSSSWHQAGRRGKSFTIASGPPALLLHSVVVDRPARPHRQLQRSIRQFRTLGVVENIDHTSRQLLEALEAGRTIIVTTLQSSRHREQIGSCPAGASR